MKKNINADNVRKILIIRLSSIGDVLLTSPFIRQVKNTFPTASIDFVVKSEYQDLLKFNPRLNNLILYEKSKSTQSLSVIKDNLKKEKYDVVFDLHNNWRSNYLRRGLKVPFTFHIKKDKFKQLLLVRMKRNHFKTIRSIPEKYLDTGQRIGVRDDKAGLEFYWDNKSEETVEEILKEKMNSQGKDYVCLAPGAGFYTKRWPVDYFLKLSKKIGKEYNIKLAVIGGIQDRLLGDELNASRNVYNFCGRLNLLQTGVLISKSKALISNDSGLMHLATAVNTPVVAIFGSSVRELGFFPHRSPHIVIENKSLYCRPCSHIGREKCPQKHFRCMRDIPVEQVFGAFSNLLTGIVN